MIGELSSDQLQAVEQVRPRRLRWLAASKLIADTIGRGLQFVLVYLAQRALGPAVYGEFTYAVAIGIVLAPLTDLGVQLIVTREIARNTANAARIAGTGLAIKFMLTAIVVAILIVISHTRSSDMQPAAIALGLAMIFNSFVEYFGYVLRGLQRVEVEAAITLIMRGLVFALGLIALIEHAGLMGLAMAYALGSGLAVVGSYGLLRRRFIPAAEVLVDFGSLRQLLREALPLGGAIAISILYTRTSIFMLDALSDSSAVGVYGVAQKLTEPLAIIPAAIMAAVFPALTHAVAQHGYASTHRLRVRTIGTLAIIGLIIAGAGWIGGPWLLDRLYGDQYIGAAIALQLLALSVLMTFVNYALTHFLIAINRQRLNLMFNAIIFVINIGLCALLIPRLGPAGAAVATLISESALLMLCGWALR
jgi:O-antigen/teichoic acid export membrane protein